MSLKVTFFGTTTLLFDDGIDRLRAIFISHTHHDHVMDAPYMAVKCGAVIYHRRV